VRGLVGTESVEEQKTKLADVIGMIDKLAKRNIIHKNKASNLKSKLMKKVLAA
jgi:small subunit ribosomal protein S20